LRDLAKRAVFGKSYLHDLESGAKSPTVATARRLDEVLEAGGQLSALVTAAPPRPGVDQERLAWGLGRPASLDASVVQSLAGVLAHQRRLEDAIGSAPLFTPVLAQATVIRSLVAQSTSSAAWRSLVATASEWACYAGWLAATTGQHTIGRRWYRQSQTWAQAIEHPDLTATAWQMQGHLAWVQGRHHDMIALSRAAAVRGRSRGVRSVAVQQEARGLALVGDEVGCAERLGQAEDLADRAADGSDGSLDWLYFYDGAFLTMQRGLADQYLGDHDAAVEHITAGMHRLPGDVRSSDWVNWYLVRKAQSQAHATDLDGARSSLDEARAVGERTGAVRLLADVEDVARRIDT
jgi:hypothetical protein